MSDEPSRVESPFASTIDGELRNELRRVASALIQGARSRIPPLGWPGVSKQFVAFADSEDSDMVESESAAPGLMAANFRELCANFGLAECEVFLVVAALSVDLDNRFAAAWQWYCGSIDATRPTLSALFQMASPQDRDTVLAVADSRQWLRSLGLLTLVGNAKTELDKTVVAATLFLGVDGEAAGLGVSQLDDAVTQFGGESPVVDYFPRRRSELDGPPTAIIIEGSAGSGRTYAATELAKSMNLRCVGVSLDARTPAQLIALLRFAVATNSIPCLDISQLAAEKIREVTEALSVVATYYAGALIISSDDGPSLDAPWQSWIIQATRPNIEERIELWHTALAGQADAEVVTELARRFPLGRGGIFRAAALARFRSFDVYVSADGLAQASREQLERNKSIAERIRTSRRIDELIAPPHTLALIQEILSFARHRKQVFAEWGFAHRFKGGLKVLFSGPPGTGKTMSAEIIAAELDLDLYKIDLSNVVSKWIGETEKNLKQVFDQAHTNGGVLLFDEADALFGKRTTNVQSSNDRHSNMEINYLLQRMEAFEGICVLTSNIENAIDEAFKRRLNFRVAFSKPDASERAVLWSSMIPEQTPRHPSLDFEQVAEDYDMAGGNIRNAALRAALLAAAEGSPLETHHLLEAARREFSESGRLGR